MAEEKPIEISPSPYAEDIDKIINNNPQKKLFWDFYLNPECEAFGDVTRCALLAGWTDSGAKDVKHQRWFKNHVRRIEMADEAERVLGDMLKISTSAIKTKDGEEYTATEPALVKIKQDTAKFITSTLLKDTYSTKSENKVSGEITQKTEISDEQFGKIMEQYARSTDKKGEPKKSLRK